MIKVAWDVQALLQEQCKIKTQRVYDSDFKSEKINEIL